MFMTTKCACGQLKNSLQRCEHLCSIADLFKVLEQCWKKSGLFGVLHVAELIFKVVNALQGDKVKLTLTFKGREMQFQEIGKDLFKVRF